MSDGITDAYRESYFALAKEAFDICREEFTANPDKENKQKLKEAFIKLENTHYGWRGCRRLLSRYDNLDGYLEYLKTINSIMAD